LRYLVVVIGRPFVETTMSAETLYRAYLIYFLRVRGD
jgi:hypothetical protein